MSHPLVTHPEEIEIILPPRLLPSAGYYAVAASFHKALIDWTRPFRRCDKATHRFDIADTRGRLRLTVPIAHPDSGATWADVELSDHGRWQETIPTALESAYGRTPFFEYYADRILPIISGAWEGQLLIDFAMELDFAVRDILGLPPEGVEHVKASTTPSGNITEPRISVRPYWQVRQDTLGFIPGLSILDLIFNLGPEAPLHLRPAPR